MIVMTEEETATGIVMMIEIVGSAMTTGSAETMTEAVSSCVVVFFSLYILMIYTTS